MFDVLCPKNSRILSAQSGTSRIFTLLALLVAFALPSGRLTAAIPPLTWRWSNPTPHGNNIVDMIATNGVVVQVGERGQIYSTADFTMWVPRDSHTTKALRSVCYFNGQFLVSGEEGTIVVGNSALDFQPVSLGTSDWLESIAASSSLAVAVGDKAAIYTSADGTNWQKRTVASTDWLRGVAFGTPSGQPRFVIVGELGFVAMSTNGTQWTSLTRFTTQDLNRVAWVNGQFWAVGNGGAAFVSNNGQSWTSMNSGAVNALNAVAGTTEFTLLAGDSELRLRDSRGLWTDELSATNSFPPPLWTYLSSFHDGTSFVVGGRTGLLLEGFRTNATSPHFWLPFTSSVRHWLWDVKRFNGVYIAVGDQASVLTSVGGIQWAQEAVPEVASTAVLLGIGGKTNLAVAVGSRGTILVSRDTPVSVSSTNTDGTTVTNQASSLGILWTPVFPSPTTNDLQGVAAFGDLLVVTGGGGTVLTSADATNWVVRATPTASFLSAVDASPNRLVAVGKDGIILTSSNALTWTPRASNTTNWIYRVRWFNGQWIAVGQNGTILTSPDGITWTPRSSGTIHWLNDVVRIDETYIAVGTVGAVLASTNAVNWSDMGTITVKSLYGAATANGQLVVAGVEGVILRAQVTPFATPVAFLQYPTNATQNVFLFGGQPDQRFSLDRSTGLTNWSMSAILEVLDSTGTLIHVDTGTNAPDRQFFRAKPVP